MSQVSDPIQQSELTGGVVLPAIIAVGYGFYLLASVDSGSSNGLVMALLGALALVAPFLAKRWPTASLLPIGLGWYTFGILGCLGLGLALAERSGWLTLGANFFWLVFGWYVLNRAARFRRFVVSSK